AATDPGDGERVGPGRRARARAHREGGGRGGRVGREAAGGAIGQAAHAQRDLDRKSVGQGKRDGVAGGRALGERQARGCRGQREAGWRGDEGRDRCGVRQAATDRGDGERVGPGRRARVRAHREGGGRGGRVGREAAGGAIGQAAHAQRDEHSYELRRGDHDGLRRVPDLGDRLARGGRAQREVGGRVDV